jgi:hypothetical protein
MGEEFSDSLVARIEPYRHATRKQDVSINRNRHYLMKEKVHITREATNCIDQDGIKKKKDSFDAQRPSGVMKISHRLVSRTASSYRGGASSGNRVLSELMLRRGPL